MALIVDHATIAARQLEPLQQAFAALGLPSTYGGIHSNGGTHMALLSFADGSYLELISTLNVGQTSPWWHAHIAGDGGPCAWAARCDDVAAEAARLARLDVAVRGPIAMQRVRPDGKQIAWELAYLGEGEPGCVLPFLIQDHTPRGWRVPTDTAVATDLLTGLAGVVVGVPDLEATVQLFQRAYDWPRPERQDDPAFGARLTRFPGTPLTLAAPLTESGWLAQRLARFGASPCAFLVGAFDFEVARERFNVAQAGRWFERPLGWFDPSVLAGIRLGLVGTCPGTTDTRMGTTCYESKST